MSCACENNMDMNNMGYIECSTTGTFIDECEKICDCDLSDQIIIKGLCSNEKLTGLLAAGDNNWTELFIPEVLCIPPQKPNVEQIISVTSKIQILSQKVIKTPSGSGGALVTNQESTNLTGRKLIIEGILRQKIVYTAAVPDQSVHSAHFDVPFSAFIVVSGDTALTTKFKIEACVEDIFVCITTRRQIFKNVTIFIKATAIGA